ncbi:MAG: TetR/AcrR family transcriptional regulator [Calditrichia bacterium]
MVYKRKSKIRRTILDVTRDLLIRKGISQVSIRMIAAQVGCSVGTIYFYFKNKDELVHALIEEGFEKLIALQEAAEISYTEPVKRLEVLCRNYINFGRNNPEYYEIMFMLKQERMARYPAEKYRRARRSLDILANALQECSKKSVIKVDDPFLAAHLIWTFMHGLVTLLHAKRIDHSIEEERIIEATIRQIIEMNCLTQS